MKQHRKLEVDDELRDLLPALAVDERKHLEESITANGCLDSIKVWKEKGLVIDGHNRFEICDARKLPFKIEELSFSSRADVLEWIHRHQKSRRNWTPEQEAIVLARILAIKQGEIEAKQSTPAKKNAEKQKVTEQVAAEQNVTVGEVVQASKWTKQIDSLSANGCSQLRTQIITRKIKSTAADVDTLAICTPEQQQAVQEAAKTSKTLREALGVAGVKKKVKQPPLATPGKKPNIGTALSVIEECLNKTIKAIDAAAGMSGGETNHSRSVKQHVHSASSSLIAWKQAWRNSSKK